MLSPNPHGTSSFDVSPDGPPSAPPRDAATAPARPLGPPPAARARGAFAGASSMPRRLHILDRALDYVALADGGLSVAAIARRRRRSKGYVSIVLRLGRALHGLLPEEIAVFRSDRITWKLAQTIVRADADGATIRRHLRAALGGFSVHNVDRRRHRTGRSAMPGATAASLASGAASSAESGEFCWRWDAAWVDRDPVGYVTAYRHHLLLLHRGIGTRLRHAIAARSAPAAIPLAGQSLRQLTALVARQRGTSPMQPTRPDDRDALRRWAELDTVLSDLAK